MLGFLIWLLSSFFFSIIFRYLFEPFLPKPSKFLAIKIYIVIVFSCIVIPLVLFLVVFIKLIVFDS